MQRECCRLNLKKTSQANPKILSSVLPRMRKKSKETVAVSIIDTSDVSMSSDGGSSHVGDNKESPNSFEGVSDPYLKIKNHSLLCLQYLFKVYNKQLFNYWNILFPSFFIKP